MARQISPRTYQLSPAEWRQYAAARTTRALYPALPVAFAAPTKLLASWGLAGGVQAIGPAGGYYYESGEMKYALPLRSEP